MIINAYDINCFSNGRENNYNNKQAVHACMVDVNWSEGAQKGPGWHYILK